MKQSRHYLKLPSDRQLVEISSTLSFDVVEICSGIDECRRPPMITSTRMIIVSLRARQVKQQSLVAILIPEFYTFTTRPTNRFLNSNPRNTTVKPASVSQPATTTVKPASVTQPATTTVKPASVTQPATTTVKPASVTQPATMYLRHFSRTPSFSFNVRHYLPLGRT
jgi:hypothetical protein